MSSILLIERDEHVGRVTLNRPEQMNALSAELRYAIGDAFRELERDERIRVVVLTGAGRAFCAGMDLKELSAGPGDATGHDTGAAGQTEMAQGIEAFGGPIIAAVNGHAITGGFELALACDVILASTKAKFADTHARVGMLPGWGLSQKLPRLIGISRAKEISFSGNPIDASTAYEWGLVNRVVAPDELLPACFALARDMAACVPHVLRGYKRLIDDGVGMPLPAALEHERKVAIESAKATTAATIASRRDDVHDRGRKG
jgi:enoyl-CoA hydratase